MRKSGVKETHVRIVQDMYGGSRTVVRYASPTPTDEDGLESVRGVTISIEV